MTAVLPALQPHRADAYLGILEASTRGPGLPAMGLTMARVLSAVADDSTGAKDLAAIILADVSLTQRLLRLANSVVFRAAARTTFTTVSQAVMVLGFERVQTLALSMLLVDKLTDPLRAQRLREEFAQSFFASALARELTRPLGQQFSETASVGALFKSMGRIIVGNHDYELLQTIDRKIVLEGKSEDVASAEVLGGPISALVTETLARWEVPDRIIAATQPLVTVPHSFESSAQAVQTIASFSCEMARALIRPAGALRDRAVETVTGRYDEVLQLQSLDMAALIERTGQEVLWLTASTGMPVLAEAATRVVRAAKAVHAGEAESDAGRTPAVPADVGAAALVPERDSAKPADSTNRLAAAVAAIEARLASQRINISEVLLLALQALQDSLGYQRAVLALKDVTGQRFKARVALGDDANAVRQGFEFSSTAANDVFGVALAQNVDLEVTNAAQDSIASRMPVWHKRLLPRTRSFLILPIAVRARVVGLVYLDRDSASAERLGVEDLHAVRALKEQVARAFETSKS